MIYTRYCINYFIQKLNVSSRYLLIPLIFFQLIISGCSTNQLINNPIDWTTRNISIYKINKYQLKGSVSLEVKKRTIMSSFELNKDNDESILIIRNFIGQRVLTENIGNILSLISKLDIDLSDKDLREIENLRIDLPSILLADISKLDSDDIFFDKLGAPKKVVSPQFNIIFNSYQELNNMIIPRKISITSDYFKLIIVNSIFDKIEISS